MVRISDQSQKDELMKGLESYKEVLEDENGETFEIIPIKDAVIAKALFLSDKLPKGFGFHDIRKLPIRDDDIVVCDYAKTGKCLNFILLNCKKCTYETFRTHD